MDRRALSPINDKKKSLKLRIASPTISLRPSIDDDSNKKRQHAAPTDYRNGTEVASLKSKSERMAHMKDYFLMKSHSENLLRFRMRINVFWFFVWLVAVILSVLIAVCVIRPLNIYFAVFFGIQSGTLSLSQMLLFLSQAFIECVRRANLSSEKTRYGQDGKSGKNSSRFVKEWAAVKNSGWKKPNQPV